LIWPKELRSQRAAFRSEFFEGFASSKKFEVSIQLSRRSLQNSFFINKDTILFGRIIIREGDGMDG